MPSRAALHRLVSAVAFAEVARLRGRGGLPLPDGPWPEDGVLEGEGIGLDSLERMGVTAAIAEMFGLPHTSLADAQPVLVGDLVDLAEQGTRCSGSITVTTSGSTGKARSCTHRLTTLEQEACTFAAELTSCRRVVAAVPAHHIYGMIWTVLLPDLLGVPVLGYQFGTRVDLQSGDLIVAVPDQWQAMLRLHRHLASGICGVSSAGALPQTVWSELLASGLDRLIEVYGASETGGIGARSGSSSDYTLLDRWTLLEHGHEWQLHDVDGRLVALPDDIVRTGERTFRPTRRRDGAVQVAGHNVWPGRVAEVLGETAGVRKIAVRLGDHGRLKAFVVPEPGIEAAELARALDRAGARRLSDAERPRAYAFGPELPRNGMGKLMDWS